MSSELMRRAIIDMVNWTDSEYKLRCIYYFLSGLLKRNEGGAYR